MIYALVTKQPCCNEVLRLRYLFSYKTEFFLSKQSQKSRSILKDGSRSLGLCGKGKTHIIAKLHWTDLVICSHFREGKTLSNGQGNTLQLIPQF